MHQLIRHLYLRLQELHLLNEMEVQLRQDLRTAFHRTSYQISSKTSLSQERTREAEAGFEKAALSVLPFSGKLSASTKTTRADEEVLSWLSYDDKAVEFDLQSFSARLA